MTKVLYKSYTQNDYFLFPPCIGYQTADGLTKIEVTLVNETVWLTLDQMARLFQRNKSTISRHIKDAFESGELSPDSTVASVTLL